MSKIALLGSTGHVGKNIIYYFSKEKNFELFLFTRDEKKLEKITLQYGIKNNFSIRKYDEFNDSQYNVIINCVGLSDPARIEASKGEILESTRTFDILTLEYLKNFSETKLINFSSGIVYGGEFSFPITDTVLIDETYNYKNIKSEYALSKINSEIKHRASKHLNIIDLRLFSFFSRFMDLESKFFMSEVVSSIKENKTLFTDNTNFYRDYIHPEDLFLFIKKCVNKNSINGAFDLYSKKPIGKFEVLASLESKYGLKYKIDSGTKVINPTGFKKNYYSKSRKADLLGYKPKYSSLDAISEELPYFLKNQESC
jgi:nucleoside-diphosphate-sugar epimerase